jgi:GNAT superfamily N-acetyltransferase
MPSIRIAETDAEIRRCFGVMRQLRTHLVETDFVSRVRLQQTSGYHLVFLEDGGEVRCVAGYRFIENLSVHGRVLYVDDLVTDAEQRSMGYGKLLLDWLAQRAREEKCRKLDLDSGVQRVDAHRFYLHNGMKLFAHHFRMDV